MHYLFYLPQPKKEVESIWGVFAFWWFWPGQVVGIITFVEELWYDRAANPHIYMSTIDLSPNDTLALNIRG